MNNLMLDLETLDTENTAVFPSFAAIQFDIETGEIGKSFYQKVNLRSAMDERLTVSAETLQWWMSQERDTRLKMFDEALPLRNVLNNFSDFLYDTFNRERTFKIWGNSASFDCGILKNGYKVLDMALPWDFRNERCYRSFIGEFPEPGKDIVRNNIHDPVADCHYQIERLCAVWRYINRPIVPSIILNKHEIKSGLDRVRHAELLIEQLPKNNGDRNTWLLNYGVGQVPDQMRSLRELKWDHVTSSCELVK